MTDAPDADSATRIRPVQPADAAVLIRLALTSKAVRGYDAGFMAACRAELTITPESISRHPTHVVEQHGQVLGFYQLRLGGAVAEVAQFFIAPAMLRRGLGRRLWAHLDQTARGTGATRVEVDSDPHAEPFYLAWECLEVVQAVQETRRCGSPQAAGRALIRLARGSPDGGRCHG